MFRSFDHYIDVHLPVVSNTAVHINIKVCGSIYKNI